MKSEVTLIIKTFERPVLLERLLRSIITSPAADCPILIADDSATASESALFERENIQYFRLPYDSGLSYGRNFLIDRVSTPYCVLLDDDFFFTSETKIDVLLNIVKGQGFDLVAGAADDDYPKFTSFNVEISNGDMQLTRTDKPKKFIDGRPVYDLVNNFFLAKTITLQDVRWDDRFKFFGEHTDFFYRYSAKYNVTFTSEVIIGHEMSSYGFGRLLGRQGLRRMRLSRKLFAEKHGVTRMGGKQVFGVRGFFNFLLSDLRNLIVREAQSLKRRSKLRQHDQQ